MSNNILKQIEMRETSIKISEVKANMNTTSTVVLGILAGAFIGMGGAASSVASHGINNMGISKFVSGMIFPVGIILVLICGAELFTGNNLMIIAALEKRIKFKDLIKNWSIVYIANFIGAIIISFLIFNSGMLNFNDAKLGGYVIKVAAAKSSLNFSTAFVSGIMCNIFVCCAIWGSYAASDIQGKMMIAWFPIMAFVVCGFEHCVANMYFLSIGMFAKTNALYVQASGLGESQLGIVGVKGFFNNMVPVTLGNIVGGVIIIGGAYYLAYKSNNK